MANTDIEQRILDLWPKFEDGSYVRLGDSYIDTDEDENEVMAIEFNNCCADLIGVEGYRTGFESFERVKRPEPEVLDADGVEIKVGDTVWSTIGERSGQDVPHEVKGFDKYGCVLLEMHNETSTGWRPEYLTHTRPDSWKRLEEDIAKYPCRYAEEVKGSKFDSCSECPWWHSEVMARDIIRRAKKLAEKEAAR